MKKDVNHNVAYPTLFWLFLFGSIAGFLFEGVWCVFRKGHWESHSSLVWGPFCIVYGIGAIAVYLLSCCLNKKNMPLQFLALSLSGGMVEYFTGLFQDLAFGSVSWDYSKHWLNIGGRVSLKMALLWGVLGILFLYCIYPHLHRLLNKIRGQTAKIICIILTIFMAVNILVSSAAVLRWRERINNMLPSNQVEELLDQFYDNEALEEIYPNMRFR